MGKLLTLGAATLFVLASPDPLPVSFQRDYYEREQPKEVYVEIGYGVARPLITSNVVVINPLPQGRVVYFDFVARGNGDFDISIKTEKGEGLQKAILTPADWLTTTQPADSNSRDLTDSLIQ
jgi:hypothetical protein